VLIELSLKRLLVLLAVGAMSQTLRRVKYVEVHFIPTSPLEPSSIFLLGQISCCCKWPIFP
jgi:hypothetical protein